MSLWDDEHRERYLAASDEARARANARHDGEHTACELPRVWQRLTRDERSVMEYLLLMGSPTVVALHDEGLLDGLVAKGLLQRPSGVGTLFMSHYETTYDVPIAVWQSMNDRRQRYLPYSDTELEAWREQARKRLHAKILVLEPCAEPARASSRDK
jgi:hypothetical protein